MSLLSGVLMASGESAATCRRANYAAGVSFGKWVFDGLGRQRFAPVAVNGKKQAKTGIVRGFSGYAFTAAATPAGRGLQRGDVRAIVGKNGAGAFEAGLLDVGNAGKQVEPVLKTFHGGDSRELQITVLMNSTWRSVAD
jgi:hypothetical protein